MKKKVLVMRTACSFLSKEWVYMCYLGLGSSVVAGGIDREKYDVDFFDYDAYLKKRYIRAEDYFGEMPDDDSSYPIEDSRVSKLFEPLEDIGKYDYILLSIYHFGSSSTPVFAFNNTLIDYIREKNSKAVVLGGGLTSYFDHPRAKRLFARLESKLDGFTRNRVTHNNINEYMEDPSTEPYGWKLKDMTTYCPEPYNKEDLEYTYREIFEYSTGAKQASELLDENVENRILKQCELIFTDGCVGKCSFCTTSNFPWETMSIDKVESILKQRLDQGYNTFFFLDNAINGSIKYLEKFCNMIVKNNMKFRWSNSMRFHKMKSDDYKMVFEAGGRIMSYGCETVDNDMLKFINKGITVDDIAQGLQWSHEAGIWNQANFIVGMPYEKSEVISSLVKFLRDNRDTIDTMYLNSFRMQRPSLFYINAPDYGIKLFDVEDSPGHREAFDGVYYNTNEMEWLELEKLKNFKKDLVVREIIKIDYMMPERANILTSLNQSFVFALYDILDDNKELVRKYYKWHLK